MATQISMRKKKRCAEEDLEKNYYKTKKKIIKQCSSSSSSLIHDGHQNKSSTWSDLDGDMLREINNKLCNYADATAFRGVCKSWRAGGVVKRAGDVLPWLISFEVNRDNTLLSYKMYEPELLPTINKSAYKSESEVSGIINLEDYLGKQPLPPSIVRYVDGWLHIFVFNFNFEFSTSYFLFYSLVDPEKSFTLPQINKSPSLIFLGLSTTTPDSPDCVFVTLWKSTGDYPIKIAIFRHGDTHWTTSSHSVGDCSFDIYGNDFSMAAVFLGGVLYFVDRAGIGSYDLATGTLKLDSFSTPLKYLNRIFSLFGLDGNLMLAYFEGYHSIFCIKKYDWMNKVWVPLQTLGGRSLYLNREGFPPYVDHTNYHGISSANKIYIRVIDIFFCVEEYMILEEDGCLSKCPREKTLVCWPGVGSKSKSRAMWVPPPPPQKMMH